MDHSPSSVADLIERARNGKPEDLDRLFAACRNYLTFVARAQVENWMQSKVDASDLVQQTLLEAHRDFSRFEGKTEGEWLAWLKRILSHNTGDFVRQFRGTSKRQINREVPLARPRDDSKMVGAPEPAADVESPSQFLVRQELELQVADALATLTDDHQQVIILRNLQRLPFDEVARQMNRSRPAAQMLWLRAIRKLQEAVETGQPAQSDDDY